MLISDIFKNKKQVISFEVFPPKKTSPIDTIYKTIEGLSDLPADYISVTYGAGGSGGNKTLEVASLLKNKYNIEPLVHLTGINFDSQELDQFIEEIKSRDLENILALRGDLPEGLSLEEAKNREFPTGVDLVKYLKNKDSFSVGAACYPEGHLESKYTRDDLIYMKEKYDNGVDFFISQLFFENENFFEFEREARKLGIDAPIQAGIMPVINKNQIQRVLSMCGAYFPRKFIKIINRYEDNPEALQEAGIAYATEQIIDLLSSGVDGIHLYTMNRPEVARKIMDNIKNIVKTLG